MSNNEASRAVKAPVAGYDLPAFLERKRCLIDTYVRCALAFAAVDACSHRENIRPDGRGLLIESTRRIFDEWERAEKAMVHVGLQTAPVQRFLEILEGRLAVLDHIERFRQDSEAPVLYSKVYRELRQVDGNRYRDGQARQTT